MVNTVFHILFHMVIFVSAQQLIFSADQPSHKIKRKRTSYEIAEDTIVPEELLEYDSNSKFFTVTHIPIEKNNNPIVPLGSSVGVFYRGYYYTICPYPGCRSHYKSKANLQTTINNMRGHVLQTHEKKPSDIKMKEMFKRTYHCCTKCNKFESKDFFSVFTHLSAKHYTWKTREEQNNIQVKKAGLVRLLISKFSDQQNKKQKPPKRKLEDPEEVSSLSDLETFVQNILNE